MKKLIILLLALTAPLMAQRSTRLDTIKTYNQTGVTYIVLNDSVRINGDLIINGTVQLFDTSSRGVAFPAISAPDSQLIWASVPHNVVIDTIHVLREGGTSDSVRVRRNHVTNLTTNPISGGTSKSATATINGACTAGDDIWAIITGVTGKQKITIFIKYHRRLK